MSSHNYRIYHKPFESLTPHELYAIIRLRNEVFVVEQKCIFQDADNKDPFCEHLMIWDAETLVTYCRLLPPGLAYEQMSIGRVISSLQYRRTGAGRILMANAIDTIHQLFGKGPIKIGAQLYLKQFYGSFGFVQTSDIYLEDNIEHIEMVRN